MDGLSLGEYGEYIWAAYIAAVAILAGLWLLTNAQAKRARKEVELLRPKRGTDAGAQNGAENG